MKSCSPPSFTEADIVRSIGRTYAQRGRDYCDQGRVVDVDWDSDACCFFAEVEGTYADAYELAIYPKTAFDGTIYLNGDCDCPVGGNCKHVAAALYHWLRFGGAAFPGSGLDFDFSGIGSSQEPALDRWLGRFAVVGQSFEGESSDPNRMLYSLRVGHHTVPPQVRLSFFQARRLKKGGFGKSKPYSLGAYYGYSVSLPRWCDSLDRRIYGTAYGILQASGYLSSDCELRDEEGALLLQWLVSTGRLFYGAPEEGLPIGPGPIRQARVDWQDEAEGRRLSIQLAGVERAEQWIALPVNPPWYLLPGEGQCGPIDLPLPGAEIALLRDMPPVPPERLVEVAGTLADRFTPADLPLPVRGEVERVEGAPVCALTLDAAQFNERKIHLALLNFVYGAERVPPVVVTGSEIVSVARDEGLLVIRRDLGAELAAMAELEDAGFAHAAGLIDEAARGLAHYLPGVSIEESVLKWNRFLVDTLPRLQAQGWQVEMGPEFSITLNPVESFDLVVDESDEGWFSLGLDIEFEGERLSLLPLILEWLERGGKPGEPLLVQAAPGKWMQVSEQTLRPVVETLIELYDRPRLDAGGRLALGQHDAARLLDLERDVEVRWNDSERAREVRALAGKLRDFQGIDPVPPPDGLQAQLRGYQQAGLSWLQFLRAYGFNGILADDMGLGKTLQTLAHLLAEKEAGRLGSPALVVAPTSLLGNWRRECAQFSPDLKTLVLHGPERAASFDEIAAADLVITSYPLITRDLERHRVQRYSHLVLDEAQNIKNPKAKVGQAVRQLSAEHRLCLTGTPLENHLGELWSLYDFLMPGFLGDERRFNQLYRIPVEKHGQRERGARLAQRVAPFLLRRTKEKVAAELPPKTEIVRSIELPADQGRLYESIRLAMEEKVRQLLQQKGLKRSQIELLDALLKLRQVCCDPRLVKLDSARRVQGSAKLELLREMLPELVEEGRRILLFSQFTAMLGLIEQELDRLGIGYTKLTGQTRKRDAVIDRFQSGEVPVFLISLKAGGVGLNLTRADTVILYDPWWNPAAENQAIDRAHRIGQDNPVMVYRLITENTVEEKVLAMQQGKQALANAIYGEREEAELQAFSAEEILELFRG